MLYLAENVCSGLCSRGLAEAVARGLPGLFSGPDPWVAGKPGGQIVKPGWTARWIRCSRGCTKPGLGKKHVETSVPKILEDYLFNKHPQTPDIWVFSDQWKRQEHGWTRYYTAQSRTQPRYGRPFPTSLDLSTKRNIQ